MPVTCATAITSDRMSRQQGQCVPQWMICATAPRQQIGILPMPIRAPGPGARPPDPDDSPQGGKVVTIPLAPRTARAIDLATGERCDGPLFLTAGGRRLDRHGAGRIVRKVARRAGITKPVGPHTLRHAFITAALDAGVPLRDVQEAASYADPRTTIRYDRARGSLDRHATYIVAAYIAGAAR
jgi:integrase